jgi:3-hydroxyisobutyrate dehydrogenase-like beta-hydroxyacid dehydrogenase
MDVGVIGLGMMGSHIALRLALKGHKVTVFNRDRSKEITCVQLVQLI